MLERDSFTPRPNLRENSEKAKEEENHSSFLIFSPQGICRRSANKQNPGKHIQVFTHSAGQHHAGAILHFMCKHHLSYLSSHDAVQKNSAGTLSSWSTHSFHTSENCLRFKIANKECGTECITSTINDYTAWERTQR